MKILHVITSLYIGGAERLLVDLLPLLGDNGNNIVELLLINGVDTPFKKQFEGNGIKVTALSNTNDVYNIRNLLRIRHFLKKHDYDIIHTHNTACQFYVPLSRKLIKNRREALATTEHSSNNRRRDKWWFRPFDKWMYNRYDAIVCIADKARQNLEEYIGTRNNIYTISNGVDVGRFMKPIKDISGQSQFVITMVAGLRIEKDHETMLKAMTHLPENYSLRLVGGGERGNELKAYTQELGLCQRVMFLGVRQDVPDILEQSDVVVLSSHWEGLSLSSIEGMSSGRPFVASDVDGLREMVGGSGVLFKHGDDKDLAEKIQWLCENPDEYKEIAIKCQEKASQYDISVMARKYLNLYRTLMLR